MLRSPDGHYGVVLSCDVLGHIVRHCIRSNGLETGGILAGRYTEDLAWAVVTDASGPPPDSTSSATSFFRGTSGTRRWLRRQWRRGAYYLGEWHFHGALPPWPSLTDEDQLREIAADSSYQCVAPILLIVSYEKPQQWSLTMHVFTAEGTVNLGLVG